MQKKHKIILGSFSTIVLISIIVLAVLLNGIIVKQNIENTALKGEISKLQSSTNNKINEVAVELINTKSSLKDELTSINENILSTNQQITQLKSEAGSDFSQIISEVIDSIVIVRTFSSQGSGFFVSEGGYLVTNEHVLRGEDGEISEVIQIITTDNKIHPGVLIGYINEIDLALIKIEEEYKPLSLEESKNVRIGEKVIAIGTPEGLSFSATDGIISATGRTGFGQEGSYVQTNAQLNPGNSGGPLLNQLGKVVGMNNFKLANTEGLGFALESDIIKTGTNTIGNQILNKAIIS
ncbi:MAG: trypsin-like peptidase domain-containing protein [Nanoarchaeota archaeon]|nr:trypsin-like peptidase domain-containing protein [Nanoarchaeota archaeon]